VGDEVHADCLVIGAGPAGLAAAIAAAGRGESVLILEKNDRPGRKLLLAGGGRANLWDPERPPLEALEAYGRPGLFLRQSLAAFDWPGFLEGLELGVEREGEAVYAAGGSRALLERLLARARAAGARVRAGSPVRGLEPCASGGLEVRAGSRPLAGLNDLEWAGGVILANVFRRDEVARIDALLDALELDV